MTNLLVTMLFFATVVVFLLESSILGLLMCMEIMMTLIFFMILSLNSDSFAMSENILILLTFMVSDSVLGLAFLVNLVRFSGKDSISSTQLLKQ